MFVFDSWFLKKLICSVLNVLPVCTVEVMVKDQKLPSESESMSKTKHLNMYKSI